MPYPLNLILKVGFYKGNHILAQLLSARVCLMIHLHHRTDLIQLATYGVMIRGNTDMYCFSTGIWYKDIVI